MNVFRSSRRLFQILPAVLALAGGASGALLGVCGPFSDVSDAAFCPFVLEIFTLGITTGTSPTTYDPGSSVTRLQMAAFLSRSVDTVLQRGSRRVLQKKFWNPQNAQSLGLTALPAPSGQPFAAESDGRDIWVTHPTAGRVSRVRGSDGRVLETWTGAATGSAIVAAMGRVFICGAAAFEPSRIYRIDPGQPAGAVTTVVSNLGLGPEGLAFDGNRLWVTAFNAAVSIVTPSPSIPWTATTITTGFENPVGALFDGGNVWITDYGRSAALRLDANGAILQTVTVGVGPRFPVFDGSNIWVPNESDSSVSVVRASSGAVLGTLTGNGLNVPFSAAFDGQRVLVTNRSGNSVSLWKAADMAALGSFPMPAASGPNVACSDGANFWIVLQIANKLVRF